MELDQQILRKNYTEVAPMTGLLLISALFSILSGSCGCLESIT
jgi:hypothetical protein